MCIRGSWVCLVLLWHYKVILQSVTISHTVQPLEGRAPVPLPIVDKGLLGTRGCAENYFVETIFVENNADVVVIP